MEKKKYPIGPEHYTLYEEVGQGVSASVHRALCKPFDEVVAIKILDLERTNCDLNNISREAQTMLLIDHPNVLKSHCSFVSDHNLWVVMPFMAGGSCLHILKAARPDGFEEIVIATILREVLKGIEYLHDHGQIHRDIKAGNILVDSRGAVKLGDFGVSACLFDSCDRQRLRNTFVGTPCWMAPEVMEQLHGYDCKADIWSFGITALELARGNAPFSKYPPMKVLLMTLQNAPPGLDYARDRKFSKSLKQMIASCLVKDPTKRPSARKLLKHSFFKQARSNEYIARTLLEGLPSIGDRIQALKRKEEDMVAQKKMPDGEKEEISQNEYKRGISGWNFNLEDVKTQASLIQNIDDSISDKGGSSSSFSTIDWQEKKLQCQSSFEDANLECSFPLVVTTTNDMNIPSSCCEEYISQNSSPQLCDHTGNNTCEKHDLEISGRTSESAANSCHLRKTLSLKRAIVQDVSLSPSKGESDKLQNQPQSIPNCNVATVSLSGDDMLSEVSSRASKSSANSDEDEKAKAPIVQQKGRFKVTSENVDLEKVVASPMMQKSHSVQVITPFSAIPDLPSILATPPLSPRTVPSDTSSPSPDSSLLPVLHSVLRTNIIQRDNILSLMKQVTANDSAAIQAVDGGCALSNAAAVERSLLEEAHDREKGLLHEITELHWRLMTAQDELQKLKTQSAQANI